LADEHAARLREQFPRAVSTAAGGDLIASASRRMAMCDLMAAWCEDAGVVHSSKGRPEVSAVARELRLLLDANEQAVMRLGEIEDGARGGGHVTLADIEAELPDEDGDVEQVDDESEADSGGEGS